MSDLDQLLRWESSGGTWRVAGRTPPVSSTLVISLCRCDGGEEMDRLTTSEPAVLAYVGRRESSEDPAPETAARRLAD
ncbi:hypothetical protein MLP_32720 [Microlunatus phosphovorus NM-1]|uniref:Uncharacterized protein n=1 Tax=Microlunatus phosphovorus (strain ATCC 700054 / DSM 10555 / JCM 9379 / NBRC 101784 / NCIMB 13414 / VKM Ac-1990 / NM-1) TaxID=1032480 RepID=F5XLM0_MICPN|nr:hypothetical protein [Microlunatus phosphovorus]BAK36286.1 hypothetical protein MLP_32720 [Microlunatus phosphovorus NM-1]